MQISSGWIQAAAASLVALLMFGVMVWQGGEAKQQIQSLYSLELRVEARLERMEEKFDDLNTRISRMEGPSVRAAPVEPREYSNHAIEELWAKNQIP